MIYYTVKLFDHYITSLFSDSLRETFGSKSEDDAYYWDNQESAQKIVDQYAGSELIIINEK